MDSIDFHKKYYEVEIIEAFGISAQVQAVCGIAEKHSERPRRGKAFFSETSAK